MVTASLYRDLTSFSFCIDQHFLVWSRHVQKIPVTDVPTGMLPVRVTLSVSSSMTSSSLSSVYFTLDGCGIKLCCQQSIFHDDFIKTTNYVFWLGNVLKYSWSQTTETMMIWIGWTWIIVYTMIMDF